MLIDMIYYTWSFEKSSILEHGDVTYAQCHENNMEFELSSLFTIHGQRIFEFVVQVAIHC